MMIGADIYYFSLISFVLIFSIWDFKTNKYYKRRWRSLNLKEKIGLVSLLVVHNIVYFLIYFTVFFLVGGMFKRERLVAGYYLIFCCSVILHWITNNNKCFLTEWQNQIMNAEFDIGFRDPFDIVSNRYYESGSSQLRNNLYYSALISNIIICCYYFL